MARVVIKLSGEALAGNKETGIDVATVDKVNKKIAEVVKNGHEVAIVVGGGNFFRGREIAKSGDERAAADYIGMLATAMNALVLQIELEKMAIATRVQTALSIAAVAEPFIRRRAIRHLEKKRIVIFGAGT
ncbi:MAG TPA: UMP kinase, partial [bacterium]|nr:UMP kinase [bacterium]